MPMTEDQIFEKYGNRSMHLTQSTLLPFECEYFCIACENNVIKRKTQNFKISIKQ